MKKFLLFLVLFFWSNLYAVSSDFVTATGYETIYDKALAKAKKENKDIMMVVVQKSCPWCRKMERQTLKRDEINSLVKSSFIPLLVDKDSNNYPKKFEAKLFPTVMFIDIKDEKLISKVLGYKNKKEFKEILNEVKNK